MNLKALVADIKRQQNYLGIENDELAAAMRVCRATLYNRMSKPEDFTLKELALCEHKLKMKIFNERTN
ncbi:MAG: hypothetical protein RR994_01425 [Clostridia bacterium]